MTWGLLFVRPARAALLVSVVLLLTAAAVWAANETREPAMGPP